MIPDWLTQKLASPPEAGTGIHAWLFSVARQLHAHLSSEAIEVVLQTATANAGRHVTAREIRDAVNNSHAVSWQRREVRGGETCKPDAVRRSRESSAAPDLATFPKCNHGLRTYLAGLSIKDGIGGLVDLWERSPVRAERSADDWLDWLFPDAEWLCLAKDHPATARSRRRESWSFGPAEQCGLLVPSPMTGPGGMDQSGSPSHRCLENTGPRRWLVIEFDSGPIDEQAALHWQLGIEGASMGLPLVLAVHSGGKSLHGWFGPCADELTSFRLMEFACLLGADAATWNRCQLVRLPGGQRAAKPIEAHLPDEWPAVEAITRQEVFYFSPYVTDQFPGAPQSRCAV